MKMIMLFQTFKLNVILLSLCVLGSVSPLTADDGLYDLTITTAGLNNSTGVVQFSLYNKQGSIPDKHFKKYYKMQKAEINSGVSSISFTDLPAGRYAVNVLHDENGNGEIDTGFILPKEGIGFSNYRSINLLNRPGFSKASFELKSNLSIVVEVFYM